MKSESIDFSNYKKSKIIIAPLNWGLGHATRCFPLIKKFLDFHASVLIASDGPALTWLKGEFGDSCKYLEIPSYNIHYRYTSMSINVILQYPKIWNAIRSEKKAIKKVVNDFCPDLIISDNRYGVYHKDIKSVFITHQLNLVKGNPLSKLLFSAKIQSWISPFNEIWVPDFHNRKLTGKLSYSKNQKLKFIGPLTRFNLKDESQKHILCILSGPEPQRTNLENKLIENLKNIEYSVVIVRGTEKPLNKKINNITIINLANKYQLETLINNAALIISRSGYTTIMDLYESGKKAIFIPTPGQVEQEYLAEFHNNTKRWETINQDSIETKLLVTIQDLLN